MGHARLRCHFVLGVAWLFALTALYRSQSNAIRETDGTRSELISKLGAVDNFTPPMDRVIPTDRLELFLSIRENLAEQQASWHPETHPLEFPLID